MSPYIINGEISIDEQQWKQLNETKTKEEIKELISSLIDDYNVPLPKPTISIEDAIGSFEELKDYDATLLIKEGEVYTRYPYDYNLSPLYIDSSTIGNKSSDFFHLDSRWLCDSQNSPSPYRSWHIKEFRMTLLNALWTLKFDKVDKSSLRSAIALRKYIASQFRPAAAKAIYQRYQSKIVLDFSSGWGDRLSGFMATDTTKEYFGIDPNDRLVEGYNKQIELFNNNKKITMNCCGAEDIILPSNYFDTVFTSPPYFNIEKYTQYSNQSWKKFKKFDSWLNDFFLPVIEKSWDSLKTGGCFIINISDVYSGHRINNICDPMNRLIVNMGGQFDGTIGLRMAKRPNNIPNKDGVFVEPIWVWKKV